MYIEKKYGTYQCMFISKIIIYTNTITSNTLKYFYKQRTKNLVIEKINNKYMSNIKENSIDMIDRPISTLVRVRPNRMAFMDEPDHKDIYLTDMDYQDILLLCKFESVSEEVNPAQLDRFNSFLGAQPDHPY